MPIISYYLVILVFKLLFINTYYTSVHPLSNINVIHMFIIIVFCNSVVLYCIVFSRRSRIFLKKRPLSCEVPSRRDSVGGSSIICLWSPEADAIDSVGGGVVAEFFCGLRKSTRFSGGGVVQSPPFITRPAITRYRV